VTAADRDDVMSTIDLNCDAGESFGAWRLGADDELLRHVSSASIACGFHAGDPSVMRRTVRTALEHGVSIGAHPGLPDLAGFGRRALDVTPEQAYELVLYQAGALLAFTLAAGARLAHVKPHGALYHMAARNRELADAIAAAVRDLDRSLVLYGLAGSELIAAGSAAGIATAAEAFADRNYLHDGSLVPRSRADARVQDPDAAAQRAVRMVEEGRVLSVDGGDVVLRPDTLCIHGDAPGAAAIARAVRAALERAGNEVTARAARGEPG
jgi:UPF0271 protein